MTVLLELLAKYWYVVVIAVLAGLVHHYHNAYTTEEVSHKADLQTAAALAKAQADHNAQMDEARAKLTTAKEAEHEKEDAARNAAAAGELARLRNSAKAMASSGVSAAGFAPKVCADPADNNRLRDALQRAKSDFGAALASYREGVSGLLVECGKNTGTLTGLQSWESEQEKIR